MHIVAHAVLYSLLTDLIIYKASNRDVPKMKEKYTHGKTQTSDDSTNESRSRAYTMPGAVRPLKTRSVIRH
jgi:hypothetical protein